MNTTATGSPPAYSGWAMVEQMGFRQTVARVSEVEMYGTRMLRLDVPVGGTIDGDFVTRFAGGPSLYQVTPMAEDVARRHVAQARDPRPVRPVDFRIEGPPAAPRGEEGAPATDREASRGEEESGFDDDNLPL